MLTMRVALYCEVVDHIIISLREGVLYLQHAQEVPSVSNLALTR